MIGGAGEDIGEPCLGIDIVDFAVTMRLYIFVGPLPAAVGAREQPCFAAKGNPTKRALGRVIGQAYPASSRNLVMLASG